MSFDWISLSISTAGALAGGVWLGWWLARSEARRQAAVYGLWAWVVTPVQVLAALRWHEGMAIAGALGALPLVAMFAGGGFYAARDYANAARSLGAGEWRIFWRLLTPMAWRAILSGTALAAARVAIERAVVDRL
jgi:molybdate transport system permease protein